MNITDLLDRPIAYHRVFVTLTGSVKAAILLSQAMYWQKRARQVDGWWYKTAEEWQEETGLTRHEQDTARRDAEKYLKTDLRDARARLYWHVDEDTLFSALFAENGQSSLTKSGKLDSRKASTIKRNAETTTETTTRGADAPNLALPLDWQIAMGGKVIPLSEDGDFLARARDSASLMDFQCPGAGKLAEAFMLARRIIIPQNKVKGNRKAAREMIEQGVRPEHVTQATEELINKRMTVVDLFSVSKTAIDLANKPKEPELPHPEYQIIHADAEPKRNPRPANVPRPV